MNVRHLVQRPLTLFIFVGMLSLTLRLVFILHVSTIQVTWGDMADYWAITTGIRNLLCQTFAYCHLTTGEVLPWNAVFTFLMFSKEGLLPILMGALMTVFPAQPLTAFLIFAVLDTLVCLMIANIVLRWNGPTWVAVLAAVIQATYIPTITGDGALIQQPLIRFAVVLILWAYTGAFTTRQRALLWVSLGTIGAVALGFSSLTTRPLMWLIPISVAVVSSGNRGLRHLLRGQLLFIAILVVAFGLLSGMLLLFPGKMRWYVTLPIMGLSTEGTVKDQTTVLSFQNFWMPTANWEYTVSSTTSLFGDFVRAPLDFAYWTVHSLFSNWRYPDYTYFQRFILDLDQQKVQHAVLTITGLAGLSWLVGLRGIHRRTLTILFVVGLYLSLAYSVISVESRRLSVLSPLLSIGAASFIWGLSRLPRRAPPRWALITLVCCAVSWLMPLSFLLGILPIGAGQTYAVLVILRVTLTAACAIWLAVLWRRSDETYSVRWPLSLAAGVLALLGVYCLQETDWRAWSTSIPTRARQEISGIQLQEHRWPWLLVDVGSPVQAKSMEIYANGQLLKESGSPMANWSAGAPPVWEPVAGLEKIANFNIVRQTWSAIAVPSQLLTSGSLTIEMRQNGTPITLRGDYSDADNRDFIGPLLDPWYTGSSLLRWQWNATDARIPWKQRLDADYVSSYYDGVSWVTGDLSPDFGRQSGRFRIFLVQSILAPLTNALPTFNEPLPVENVAHCPSGQALSVPDNKLPFVCRMSDNTVQYYTADGQLIGSSQGTVFKTDADRDTVIDHVSSRHGSVDLIQILDKLFVANVYSVERDRVYSVVFNTLP